MIDFGKNLANNADSLAECLGFKLEAEPLYIPKVNTIENQGGSKHDCSLKSSLLKLGKRKRRRRESKNIEKREVFIFSDHVTDTEFMQKVS